MVPVVPAAYLAAASAPCRLEALETRRLHGLGSLAGQLAESGELRPELSVEEARDLIWTLCSTTLHELLVRERNWTPERYRDWLAAALKRELLTESSVAGK
jgi:hypothetical protein